VSDGEICPTCSGVNSCGMEKGESTCWCFAMPHVVPVSATEEGGRCYCRACLTRVIGETMGSDSSQSNRPQ
jgi:Cysteine-rich CWC